MLRIEGQVMVGISSGGNLFLDGKQNQALVAEMAIQAAKQTPHEVELLSKVLEGGV